MRRLLVALVVIVPALVACGDGGGDGTNAVSIKTLQLAAANTQDAESTRFETLVKLDADSPALRVSGVTSGDGSYSQVVMELPDGERAEQRIVDGVLYLDVGSLPFAGARFDGKRWFELDLRGIAGIIDDDWAATFGRAQTPASALEQLEQLSGDVERVGEDNVAGRPATHYRSTVVREGITAPVDVWIDGNDRVVKMHVVVPETGFETSMEIVEFGAPVDVVAPPAGEIMSLWDLITA